MGATMDAALILIYVIPWAMVITFAMTIPFGMVALYSIDSIFLERMVLKYGLSIAFPFGMTMLSLSMIDSEFREMGMVMQTQTIMDNFVFQMLVVVFMMVSTYDFIASISLNKVVIPYGGEITIPFAMFVLILSNTTDLSLEYDIMFKTANTIVIGPLSLLMQSYLCGGITMTSAIYCILDDAFMMSLSSLLMLSLFDMMTTRTITTDLSVLKTANIIIVMMSLWFWNNRKRNENQELIKSPTLLLLTDLPLSVRINILNLLGGQTQEQLMNLMLVSKQFYKDCKRPGIEWKIVPIIIIRPSFIRTRAFMQNLTHLFLINENEKEKLQIHQHMRVEDVHRFYFYSKLLLDNALRDLARGIQWDKILSLDLSSSYSTMPLRTGRDFEYGFLSYFFFRRSANILPFIFSNLLPHLHEIDLSNTLFYGQALEYFSQNCPFLEKVTWNNNIKYYKSEWRKLSISGTPIRHSNNLKEIYMDDSVFYCLSTTMERERISNLTDPAFNNWYIFSHCSNTLERVSIRNAKWFSSEDYKRGEPAIISQNALIKFVRNVPSLQWFRSDLTQDNIDMLQLERPDIEFIN